MKLSIILCTYNRAESLRETLRALTAQRVPAGVDAEIVVVDNNSSDGTREVVGSFARMVAEYRSNGASEKPAPARRHADTRVQYFFEPKQGKSHALNRGIKEAQGEILAFTDDDVLPQPEWLQEIVHSINRFEADCVGGPIRPIWENSPPCWLQDKRRQLGLLALLDRGDVITGPDGEDNNFLLGANIAIKKSVFQELGNYRTDLGPTAGTLNRGEDSEMMRRMLRAGKKVIYVPSVIVSHHVSKERMTLAYMRKWQFDAAKSHIRTSVKSPGIPRWFIRRWLTHGMNWAAHSIRGQRLAAIEAEEHFWAATGSLVGRFERIIKESRSKKSGDLIRS